VMLFVCDLGFGLPNEVRPRKEKLLAISRQIVNFLYWQEQERQNDIHRNTAVARILMVVSDGDVQQALLQRMQDVWQQQQHHSSKSTMLPFPDDIISFTQNGLEAAIAEQSKREDDTVYLSPDAEATLDPSLPPPATVVVGMLIDRRHIQVNRSVDRARKLSIPAARWPLESIDDSPSLKMHKNEPLNIDCVLEGMQQWYWNYYHCQSNTSGTALAAAACFQKAAIQAIRHHQARHPERPRHKDSV